MNTQEIIKTVQNLPLVEQQRILEALQKNLPANKTQPVNEDEIRRSSQSQTGGLSEIEREDYRRFQETMLAEGLISEIKPPRTTPRNHDFPLLEVEGKPVSEIIIEERR